MTAANALDGKSHDRGPHGLSWQYTRGSALLGFVHDDAAYVADRIAADQQAVMSAKVATGPPTAP